MWPIASSKCDPSAVARFVSRRAVAALGTACKGHYTDTDFHFPPAISIGYTEAQTPGRAEGKSIVHLGMSAPIASCALVLSVKLEDIVVSNDRGGVTTDVISRCQGNT